MTMTSPWFYSFLYNISYMAIDWALIMVIGLLLVKPMKKWFQPQGIA